MTHTIAEIDEELRQLSGDGGNRTDRPELRNQLNSILAELWDIPGSDARDLRCRVRTLIDEGKSPRSA
jgi:hypothetical protein